MEAASNAQGLPLVLEILGSLLFGKTIPEWRSELKKLKRIPHGCIHRKLRLSFDSLDDEQKALLLDIACFFVGADKNFAIKILEGFDFFPESGIGVLTGRCLLKINSFNQLAMHDVIRGMGLEIVLQESPREPGERSRLWYHQDVIDVLRHNAGTKSIECLVLNLPRMNELRVDGRAFSEMRRLRLLHLNFVHLGGGYEHLSERLVWLCWKGFPLKCIPSTLNMDSLVAIDLSYSSLKQAWRERKVLSKLRFLNLSHCYSLIKTPDFTGPFNLEKLMLNDCTKLLEIHPSVGRLKHVVSLDLRICPNLRRLTRRILMRKSLGYLDLFGCSKLDWQAGIRGSPSKSMLSFWSFRASRKRGPDSVISSPASVQGLSCLRRLIMENCNISYVPSEIGSLVSLNVLILSGNRFSSLPASIVRLSRPEVLYVNRCAALQALPSLPINLQGVNSNHCTSLERISIASTMEEAPFMTFYGCPKLVENNLA